MDDGIQILLIKNVNYARKYLHIPNPSVGKTVLNLYMVKMTLLNLPHHINNVVLLHNIDLVDVHIIEFSYTPTVKLGSGLVSRHYSPRSRIQQHVYSRMVFKQLSELMLALLKSFPGFDGFGNILYGAQHCKCLSFVIIP